MSAQRAWALCVPRSWLPTAPLHFYARRTQFPRLLACALRLVRLVAGPAALSSELKVRLTCPKAIAQVSTVKSFRTAMAMQCRRTRAHTEHELRHRTHRKFMKSGGDSKFSVAPLCPSGPAGL